MHNATKQNINVVVIHLTGTAVYAVIGYVQDADLGMEKKKVKVLAASRVLVKSFFQGNIINRDELKVAIKNAIRKVEDMSNMRAHTVWVSFSSPEMKSEHSCNNIDMPTRREITASDMVEALKKAKAKSLSPDLYLVHYCQSGIWLDDGETNIVDAIGLVANTMRVAYHLMMLPVSTLQSIQKLIQDCDLQISHIIFDVISSAEYALMAEERKRGVCLIDIGFSSTNICVYKDDVLLYTDCIPIGGHTVTRDIEIDLYLSTEDAEHLKKIYGSIGVSEESKSRFLPYTCKNPSGKKVNIYLYQLFEIITARYDEILANVAQRLVDRDLLESLEAGVVLSGGGSQIRGLREFIKKQWGIPVHLSNDYGTIEACDQHLNEKDQEIVQRLIKDRTFNTALGTLLYSQSEQFLHSENSSEEVQGSMEKRVKNIWDSLNKILKRYL